MKKKLSLILSICMVLTIACTMNIGVSASPLSVCPFDFNNRELPSGAPIIGSEGSHSFENVSDGDYALVLTLPSESTDLDNGYALTSWFDINASEAVNINYDIKIQSGFEATENVFGLETRINWSEGFHGVPNFTSDYKLGAATWAVDTWYTVSLSFNLIEDTFTMKLTDKATGTVQTACENVSVGADIPADTSEGNDDVLFFRPMCKGSVWLDNISYGPAYINAIISSPAEGEVLVDSTAAKVTGKLPAGYDSAVLKLDGEVVKTLDSGLEDFTATIDTTSYNYGRHILSLEATYGTEVLTDSKTINITSNYNLVVFDGMGAGEVSTTKNNITISFPGGGTNNGGVIVTSGGSWDALYNGFGNDNYEVLVINEKISFSNAASSYVMSVRDTAEGYILTEYPILNNGTFVDGTTCVANQEYDLKITLDIVNRKIIHQIDNNTPVSVDCPGFATAKLSYLVFGGTYNGGTCSLENITLSKVLPKPYISSMEYTVAGSDVDEANWKDNKVNTSAEAIVLNMSGVIENNDDSMPLAILKKVTDTGTSTVSSEVTQNGTKIIVNPATDFEPNSKYLVEILNPAIGGEAYGKKITTSFETVAEFAILLPKDGQVFDGKNVTLTATVPEGTPVFKLDGEVIEMPAPVNGKYSKTINEADIAFGDHTFEVEANGEKDSSSFTVKKLLGAKEYAYVADPNLVAETFSNTGSGSGFCAGADGTENGGYKIVSSGLDAVYQINVNDATFNTTKEVVVFETDILRSSNASFDLSCKDANWSSAVFGLGGSDGYMNPLISASGVIKGTSYIVPANEWHNIRVVQQLAAAGEGAYEIYYDGTLILSGKSSQDTSSLGWIKIMVVSSNNEYVCLDNTRFAPANSMSPEISAVEYAVGDTFIESEAKKLRLLQTKLNSL